VKPLPSAGSAPSSAPRPKWIVRSPSLQVKPAGAMALSHHARAAADRRRASRVRRGRITLTAVLIAEIGDFSAFAHPGQLASFVGLVFSQRSSGDEPRQGTIAKPAGATPAGCSSSWPGITVDGSPSR